VGSLIRLRNTPEDRYISGSFQDLPRDPETEDEKSLWDESDGYMAKQPISKGSDQAFMVYYRSPQNKHGLPPFINNPIRMDSYVGLPFYKIEDEVNLIPINVRPDCATLGFAYLDLPDVDLSKLFPADVAADGVPFSDRLCWGTPCRPRALFKDFPLRSGKWAYGDRIACIIHEDEVIFLGGEGFDPKQSTENDWLDFHHWYINISAQDRKALKPVLQEETEIKRRATRNPLQPPGELNAFDGAHRNIHGLIQQYRKDPNTFTQEDFETVMNWIPTRGYNEEVPSFNLSHHAGVSGSMYSGGFKALAAHTTSRYEAQGSIIRDLDQGINRMSGAHFATPEDVEPFLVDLGQQLVRIQNNLVQEFSAGQNLVATVQKVLDQVPEPLSILGGLPSLIFNDPDFKLATQVGRMNTDVAPLPQNTHWAPRKDWRVEVNTNHQDWHIEPESLGSYKTFDFPNRSDSILRERLLQPTNSLQHSEVPKPASSTKPGSSTKPNPQPEVTKGSRDSLGKRKVSWDREDSEEDSTPTKKRGGKQVRPVVKTKTEPAKKNAARKSTSQPKPQTEDQEEVGSASKPRRRTYKGDTSKLPPPTVPGWSQPPKTPSSLQEGKV